MAAVAGFGVGAIDTALYTYLGEEMTGSKWGGVITGLAGNVITAEAFGWAGKKAKWKGAEAFKTYHKIGGLVSVAMKILGISIISMSGGKKRGVGYNIKNFVSDLKSGKLMKAMKLPVLKGMGLDIQLPSKFSINTNLSGATPDRYSTTFPPSRPAYGAVGRSRSTGALPPYSDNTNALGKTAQERQVDAQLRSLGVDVEAFENELAQSNVQPMGGITEAGRRAGLD